jgi:hypothetical protein
VFAASPKYANFRCELRGIRPLDRGPPQPFDQQVGGFWVDIVVGQADRTNDLPMRAVLGAPVRPWSVGRPRSACETTMVEI